MITQEEFKDKLMKRVKAVIPIVGEQAIEMNGGAVGEKRTEEQSHKISKDFNDLMLFTIEFLAREMKEEFNYEEKKSST